MSSLAIWSKFAATMGRDGIQLAQALAKGMRNKTPARPILLEHARQSNSAAVSLLRVDQQIGLMQYHGLSTYLQQRFQSSTTSTNDANAITATTVLPEDAAQSTTNNNNKGARVAFMVTTAMKTDLTDRLGYNVDQIKQLTPMQASLVLHHNVTPATMEQELPTLMQAHEEAERVQQEEEEVQREQQEQQQREEQQQQQQEDADTRQLAEQQEMAQQYSYGSTDTPSTPPTSAAAAVVNRDVIDVSGGYMSVNLLGLDVKNCSTSGFADNWFEVTENKDGVISRVGLYVDQEEADLGCSTRQWIADRNGQPYAFQVNKVAADTLL
jgi:hypothetical protein